MQFNDTRFLSRVYTLRTSRLDFPKNSQNGTISPASDEKFEESKKICRFYQVMKLLNKFYEKNQRRDNNNIKNADYQKIRTCSVGLSLVLDGEVPFWF